MRHYSYRPISYIVLLLIVSLSLYAATERAAIASFESKMLKKIKSNFALYNTNLLEERVYLQTDKSFYKPGETIWITTSVRDAATLKPSIMSDIVHLEFINPKGNIEHHYKLIAHDGMAAADIDLTDHLGGIYRLRAYTQFQKNESNPYYMEREITVQSVVMPRLKMKLDWEKKAYGKGDEVEARVELNTNSNKPLAQTPIKYKVYLAGKSLLDSTLTTSDSGKAVVKFRLPADLATTEGMVNILIDYEGSTESISRAIPIVLNQINLSFYPEGGDLVLGARSRLAFKATNEYGKAADIEGFIFDDKDQVVSKFSSYHFGMGAVDLVPQAGRSYHAKVTKPQGVGTIYTLPDAIEKSYLLRVETGKNELTNTIYSYQPELLNLVAQVRGRVYFSGSIKAQKGENKINIPTRDMPMGVVQVSLFDSMGVARAERLAFVNKTKQLHIAVSSDKPTYQPREKVTLNLRVLDDKGVPVNGHFGLGVVDDNLLSYADDKQGTILSRMYLEPELKEKVEEANFYFDPKESKADKALDYLLLTSGWRRFVWKKVLNAELGKVKYGGEKAELSGRISDVQNKAVKGAEVKLLPSGIVAMTDSGGHYRLKDFDISTQRQIEILAVGYQKFKTNIYDYSSRLDYTLYSEYNVENDPRRFMNKDISKAGRKPAMGNQGKDQNANGARREMRNQAYNKAIMDIGDAKLAQTVTKAEIKNIGAQPAENLVAKAQGIAQNDAGGKLKINGGREDEVQYIVNGKRVVAAAPAMLDEAPIPFDKKPKAEEVEANKDALVGDVRLADLNRMERPANNQAVYYRAKEFPIKTYLKSDTSRTDFATTLYWNGNVETDQNGKAKVEFVTTDLISSFRTTVEGFGDNGMLGHGEHTFATAMLFSIDTKVPSCLVSGDQMSIPVFLKNTGEQPVSGMVICPQAGSSLPVTLAAHSTQVVYLPYRAVYTGRDTMIDIAFNSPTVHDQIIKPIKVIARGFPALVSLAGQDMNKDFSINPQGVVSGSMRVSLTVYPSVMTELMSGIDAILREPNGCFEQTSSSNYPNIMALSYLKSMNVDNPALENHATALLDKGYDKLLTFETKENGYEWWGAAPAHEALTAYGLMEFQDMKKVYPRVSQEMIDRTAKKLMDNRDGLGGFKRNGKALDAFGRADEDITNAYIVYAMSEAGQKDIKRELDASERVAKKSDDPYLMALIANALYNLDEQERGDEMIQATNKLKNANGWWTGKKHSITRSEGLALNIETTSLIALAAMKSKKPDELTITTAMRYLAGTKNGLGGYGSTQSTILALKAMTQYALYSRKTSEGGTVEVYQDGNLIATRDYDKGAKGNIIIDGLERKIGEGSQKITVKFKGCKTPLPYSMAISYATTSPNSSSACVLGLETKIEGSSIVKVGETLHLSTTLTNTKSQGQPMSMVIIGIPAGFTAQPWQLKDLMDKKLLDFYEVLDNNLVCYYRSLAPSETRHINLDLKAEVKGEYEAPASSAYLYYTNENKVWRGIGRVIVQ